MRESDRQAQQDGVTIWDARVDGLFQALGDVATAYRAKDLVKVEASARFLAGQAHDLGLNRLFRVCRHVVSLVHGKDPVALAANVARLVRLGDGAVSAAWRRQDARF